MMPRTTIAWVGLTILLSVGEANATLISYWAAEGDAVDSVGPNSGTLVDGVGFAPGVVGQAFRFDRTSYVQAPTIGLPTGSADRTLNLWFQINSYSPSVEEEFLAGYGAFGSFTQAYAILVNHFNIAGPTGDVVVWSQWGTGIGGGPAIQTGTWHNLGVTNSGGFATLYLDGVVVGSGTFVINTAAGSNFYIGRIPGSLGGIRRMDGFVDEVRVYDTALSAAEMRALAGVPEPSAALLLLGGLLGLAARRRRSLCRATAIVVPWLVASAASALPLTVATSIDPADGWRAIAPVGDLAGQPITSVGLAWEAAHVGWNTSLGFDDSAAAGWHAPVYRDVSRYGSPATNHVWVDDPQGSGDTPGYVRKVFTLDADPMLALLGGVAGTLHSVIDDDAQIWINGTLVFDDRDGVATTIPRIDVTALLHTGQNLIAAKVHDSFGIDEHFALLLRVDPALVPEPATGLLLVVAGTVGSWAARHQGGRPERRPGSDRRGPPRQVST